MMQSAFFLFFSTDKGGLLLLVEIPIKINPMKQFQGFDKNEYKVEAPSLSLTQVIFMGL